MDFNRMSAMMKDLIPSDPQADKAALLQMANAPVQNVPPTKDYVNESAEVAPGSLPVGDLDLSGLAALAGVAHTPKQVVVEKEESLRKSLIPGLQKTSDEVEDEGSPAIVQAAIRAAMEGEVLTSVQRDAFAPYAEMLDKILSKPSLTNMLNNIMVLANKADIKKDDDKEKEETKESIASMLRKQLASRNT